LAALLYWLVARPSDNAFALLDSAFALLDNAFALLDNAFALLDNACPADIKKRFILLIIQCGLSL